jgi:hypothetical protein
MAGVRLGFPLQEGKFIQGLIAAALQPGMNPTQLLVHRVCAMTGVFGYANAFGVYQDHYVRQGVASASSASWIGSLQIFILIASGSFTGPLVDRGYFRATFLSGSILFVFSCVIQNLVYVYCC